MVDEDLFSAQNHIAIRGRTLGIDLNPDYIAYSITDFPKEKVVLKECYETKELNKKSAFASSHPRSKRLCNKRVHEYINLCHEIVRKCIHYGVEKLVIEDLNISGKDYGNKALNRKNNYWMRSLIANKLKILCIERGIGFVEINPAYSSVVGNMTYDDFDPVASSREIARRGYYKFEKGMFYPSLESVKHQWKEMVTEGIETWKDLYLKIKTLDLRYRVPMAENAVVCRNKNTKKLTTLYSFV
jgi:IS605 OrfB family transposase